MISKTIAGIICIILLYCAFVHFRKIIKKTDVGETAILYGFFCIVAAWIVAKIGGL